MAPHQLNSWHPRTLSYFTPPPLAMSIVGELLAQFTNQGVDVWHAGPIGAFVEEEVGRWLCDLVGYGPASFGILTSGGVMANLMAMTVARDVHLRRILGLDRPPRGAKLEGVRVYASDQTHFSIARALDELGFPTGTLHLVPADDRFRLRGEAVARAVAEDRAAGLVPWVISAVAGSTNTGSVDLTEELSDVARREGLWLHVDAAYGGGALLSERDRSRVPGLDRADSVTIDPHKWFFQAYDIGGLLVRRGDDLLDVYHHAPEYYRGGETPVVPADPAVEPNDEAEQLNFYQRSLEGTRRWRALKLWMSWKHLGTRGFGRLVEANDDLAAYLARRCAEADDFEVASRGAGAVRSLLPPPAGWDRGRGASRSGRARPSPGPPPDRARRLGRRLDRHDRPARNDLAAGGDRQPPRDRGGHRPDPRRPSTPRRRGDAGGPGDPMTIDGATGSEPAVDRSHLAQLNIARSVAPIDDPAMADFVANLDRINALGEATPGFVWRLKDETGSATAHPGLRRSRWSSST